MGIAPVELEDAVNLTELASGKFRAYTDIPAWSVDDMLADRRMFA